jgi:hypothetical protein
MTDLPRLPPGVLLSSSTRNNEGTLRSIYFSGCATGVERYTKYKQKERAQSAFHYKHIYTLTGYDDVISCTDMCVGKQWVRGRGGRLKWGDCTSAADCGKIRQVFWSTAIPLPCPSSAARAIDKGGYKKPDPFISQYSPFHRRQFSPSRDGMVALSLSDSLPSQCWYPSRLDQLLTPSNIVSSYCRANSLCRVPSQCED